MTSQFFNIFGLGRGQKQRRVTVANLDELSKNQASF